MIKFLTLGRLKYNSGDYMYITEITEEKDSITGLWEFKQGLTPQSEEVS